MLCVPGSCLWVDTATLPLLAHPSCACGQLRHHTVLALLQGCFSTAIRRYEYTGAFRGVFPVKCNHDRRLIVNMLEAGRDSGVGLEAGSKAVRV
jgi:arginine decarboxylase-like protein